MEKLNVTAVEETSFKVTNGTDKINGFTTKIYTDGWGYLVEYPNITSNCGLRVVSMNIVDIRKEFFKFIQENSLANRLLFDVAHYKADSLVEVAKELGYKVLGRIDYPSRYTNGLGSPLAIVLIEINPYGK